MAEVPEKCDARIPAYLHLKRHGQALCKRTGPRCSKCPVSASCAYFAGNRRGPRGLLLATITASRQRADLNASSCVRSEGPGSESRHRSARPGRAPISDCHWLTFRESQRHRSHGRCPTRRGRASLANPSTLAWFFQDVHVLCRTRASRSRYDPNLSLPLRTHETATDPRCGGCRSYTSEGFGAVLLR